MTNFIDNLAQLLGYFTIIVGLIQYGLLFGYGLYEYLKQLFSEKRGPK